MLMLSHFHWLWATIEFKVHTQSSTPFRTTSECLNSFSELEESIEPFIAWRVNSDRSKHQVEGRGRETSSVGPGHSWGTQDRKSSDGWQIQRWWLLSAFTLSQWAESGDPGLEWGIISDQSPPET